MFCLFFQPEFASKNGVLATTELAESSILEDLPPAITSDAFAQMVSWLSRYIILLRVSEIMARLQNEYTRQ